MKKKWFLVDAKNKILGRLSSRLSLILQGKNYPDFNYNKYFNNIIILINAKYIKVTGNKFNNKIYYKYTGYIGNLKSYKFKDLFVKKFKFIIINSIKGMLPKNKLGKNIINNNLKIFPYSDHIYKNINFNKINL